MSYDNAEPKILKTLNSNGQVLNSSGEVIADTSEYWVKTYNQAEPKPDKILNADGTITDSAGNLIQATTPFNVKKYNQAEPIPAKYLHADGTIDENPGSGGGADLENNHQTTIDVSTYTEPVEVTPTAGKDGMKKNTVTLTNIPSGGGAAAYAWKLTPQAGEDAVVYFPMATAPSDKADYLAKCVYKGACLEHNGIFKIESYAQNDDEYTKVSDNSFTVSYVEHGETLTDTFVKEDVGDFVLWQLSE